MKEQRTNEQVTKEREVGEEEEDRSEDLGNRRKKKGYGGGEGEAELFMFSITPDGLVVSKQELYKIQKSRLSVIMCVL